MGKKGEKQFQVLFCMVVLLLGCVTAVREARHTVKKFRMEDGRCYQKAHPYYRVPDDEIVLEEVPEMGIQWGRGIRYICYKDILVLNYDVYQKKGDAYVKTDVTVQDWFLKEEDEYCLYRQAGNKIIENTGLLSGNIFSIYDMDTGSLYSYFFEGTPDVDFWYVYQGYIYYIEKNENGKGVLRRINLNTWENSEYFEGEEIFAFVIQKDGDIIYESNPSCCYPYYNREYWILKKGEKEGRKLWEYGQWESDNLLAYTEQGLVIYGEFILMEKGHLGKSVGDEYLLITEEGEEKVLLLSGSRERDNYYCDFGYFVPGSIGGDEKEWEIRKKEEWGKNACITLYSYDNEKLASYWMVDQRLLDIGYRLEVFFYHKGRLTAFYKQKETGKLHISQAYVEETIFEKG